MPTKFSRIRFGNFLGVPRLVYEVLKYRATARMVATSVGEWTRRKGVTASNSKTRSRDTDNVCRQVFLIGLAHWPL